MSTPDPRAAPLGASSSGTSDAPPKYHALILDSGAIIKQTALGSTGLLAAASKFYTTPAVLAEIRDAKSRKHLEELQVRLQSLHDATLEARTPSKEGLARVAEFSRKTGDYPQLSGADLQVLALLYDMEAEAAGLYNDGKLDHVRREPKRVLGVHVQALNGDGKRTVQRRERGDSVAGGSVASMANSTLASGSVAGSAAGNAAFFRRNADGIIDAANVDYDEDEEDNDWGGLDSAGRDESTSNNTGAAARPKSWATLVNPARASTAPPVEYTIAAPQPKEEEPEEPALDLEKKAVACSEVAGQFDDASEEEFSAEECDGEDDADHFPDASDSDGELDAIDIANAASDVEMSDEECDVFVLEPHEAAYFKKLREEKEAHVAEEPEDEDGPEAEFPSLAAAAAVPYEGSDDEGPDELAGTAQDEAWQKEEEARKKQALQPMVNGRVVSSSKQTSYNSFRKYKGIVSAGGSAVAMQKQKKREAEEKKAEEAEATESAAGEEAKYDEDAGNDNQEYKTRIIGAAAADFPSEMTAEDDDGEGWVTCTRDIRTMKATGSLRPDATRHSNHNKKATPRKDSCPPLAQRAACATTDFAMQNVILQMNLELLSVDGVRVRRLKTWVTRCGACFTIYGNDAKNRSGGRLFCDKCGSDTLQRISASVDRNTGRLKLHMKKHYQHNTRGTKFALPKAGTANKYEGDLLLAEDQLMYGAWNQKVRKGKSKGSGQSIFGSDLASDLGCHADLSKRDDIRVGFGRRNPNATKFGRERRGKKKKGAKGDKACGLRRY
ncbi:hypothetical protein ACHAXT_012520 [Thalassiosira profunda]